MKNNNKTLLLIYLRGAFSLIVLLIVYYLIINLFKSVGLQNQTRLALIFGGIHGFIWTLLLSFVYPNKELTFNQLSPSYRVRWEGTVFLLDVEGATR